MRGEQLDLLSFMRRAGDPSKHTELSQATLHGQRKIPEFDEVYRLLGAI